MKDTSNTTLVLGLIVIVIIIAIIMYASDTKLFTKLKKGKLSLDTGQEGVHSTTTDAQWEAYQEMERQQELEENQ